MDVRANKFPETIQVALVGVGQPIDAGLAPLSAVEGETLRLKDVLLSPTACRISDNQLLCLTAPEETTREGIISALRKCSCRAAEGDIIFFYFAGHGVKSNGSFALVPSDGILSRPETLITSTDLGLAFAGTYARGILIVADCCGGSAIYENARALFGYIENRLEFRILLSSSKEGESSWEITGRGSPFTAALIEALHGNMAGMGAQGEIYFTSLMAHVVARVEELLQSEYAGLPPQHPSFDGSFEKDPLLFVNSDIAIGGLLLKTARYSPEYVRRRVSKAVGTLAAAIIIVVVGYWTWLDQHYFFRLDGGYVTLYQGYPNFPWPGMPRRLWQFGVDRTLLLPDSALANEKNLAFAKLDNDNDILEKLRGSLSTKGRFWLAGLLGRADEARQIARTALDTRDSTVNSVEMLNAYAYLGTLSDEDKNRFASIINDGQDPSQVAIAFAALIQFEPDIAIKALKDSKNAFNPNVLLGLSSLQPPCSDTLRSFLYYRLMSSDQPDVAEFAMSGALQANCRSAAIPFFVRASRSQTKTFGYFNQLQSDTYRRLLSARVLRSIKKLPELDWNDKEDVKWTRMAIEELMFSGSGPCDITLIDAVKKAPPSYQLDVSEYLLNSCSDVYYEIVPQVGGNAVEILVKSSEDLKATVLFDFNDDDNQRDRVLDFVQRRDKIHANGYLIDDVINAYLENLGNRTLTNNDVERGTNAIKWAVQLNYWSPALQNLLFQPQQPVSIRKWVLLAALSASPEMGVKMLLQRFDDFVMDYDNLIRMIVVAHLPSEQIKTIRSFFRQSGEHNLYYVVMTALYGDRDEVLALLTSVDATDRGTAFDFVAFRDDLPAIAASVGSHPRAFDPNMANLLGNLKDQQKNYDAWLAGVPDWALDWRIYVTSRLYGPLGGLLLRNYTVLRQRKTIGIERPFNSWLLKFSW
ncbi:caspase family protein [Methylosinus sp. H3A]|uniref:caspase family protein n=1 Tax=Methylosinus sp. H3A TaxID=2785786 RepID=UPI0018C267DC|nr:caspase family protein [Methylosinus sp. H3A]MBG0808199.1 caspase family protein [Methylosinus sp. H3A]